MDTATPHLPFGLPPVLPDLSQELESYLTDPGTLPIHNSVKSCYVWPRKPQPERLFDLQVQPASSTLKVERDFNTGRITAFHEVRLHSIGTTAKNSSSLLRRPAPKDQFIRGSSTSFPFWPGGFDQDQLLPDGLQLLEPLTTLADPVALDPALYLSLPPGFDVDLHPDLSASAQPDGEPDLVVNLADMNLHDKISSSLDGDFSWLYQDSLNNADVKGEAGSVPVESDRDGSAAELDKVLGGQEVPVLSISPAAAATENKSTAWAEVVDVSQPMLLFHQLVPQMAMQWPFELDTFQKQAILCLERSQSVFISAHTSAGKTVVADYAIALSQKHLTRAIYTSPIKALSNQKFRDFREQFHDVGLITGDIQINPAAFCLIMTTEVLRSMLYNGSDVIRDLEFVIFDEVHYINDSERGVVWEEVLILLPDHVNIIMLSATVPNTVEFADWVGRTKKKKIHVISTAKRPVPLEHHLYTGSNGKTRDERFLIMDAQGQFLEHNHKKAVMAKKERESKSKQQFGSKGLRDRVGVQQEKNVWLTLIEHLSKQDKLPVVAFTFSRARCNQNANLLTSLDLTTAVEKTEIHHFIHKCVQCLKGSDRKLPQVLNLTELLKRGIGIHHSGILPILKEVVELLFQKGWLKLLFATETFSMGINMPARTVVFDSMRKHDGKEVRNLLPSEYIQMAGRAGRRGLDSTGTVIILCKGEVYPMHDLLSIMRAKPTHLESKFRLTYSMILNLLRVEQLRVEDMMKRSFSEVGSQKNQNAYMDNISKLKLQLNALELPKSDVISSLQTLYQSIKAFVELKSSVWKLMLSHPAAVKALSPGRFLLLSHYCPRTNLVGILIGVDSSIKDKTYSVLVLAADHPPVDGAQIDEKLMQYLSLAEVSGPALDGYSTSAQLLLVKDTHVAEILLHSIKIDPDKIKNDIAKRQIPRFRNDPPSAMTAAALEELTKFYHDLSNGAELQAMDYLKDFKIQDLDLLDKLSRLQRLRHQITATIQETKCTEVPGFGGVFEKIFRHQQLTEELSQAEFLVSEESLKHLEGYRQRVEVLQKLNYIDSMRTVQLKGRVACEMGNHELLITELVFNNVLTDRPPEEIAALLSCLVFQNKNCSKPELTPSLMKGIDEIKECALTVGQTQRDCGFADPAKDYVEQFHFGLVQVVHEWAKGLSFSAITQLTDVPEGEIVRTIQRLDEVLRNVKDGARVIGDPILYQKMDTASSIIKRDIVFTASLYTQ